MALAERTPPPNPRTHGCSVKTLLDRLEGTERETLLGWLEAPMTDVTHSWIAEQLTDEFGYRFGSDTVGRHRKGRCAC